MNKHQRKVIAIALVVVAAAALAVFLLTAKKELTVRMLYATHGDEYDPAAFSHLSQSLVANLDLERKSLNDVNARKLTDYDTVYLDPSLHGTLTDPQRKLLQEFVAQGGHLFLENSFAGGDFPLDFLGASQVVDVPPPARKARSGGELNEPSPLQYPTVEYNLQGVQQLLQQFADGYFRHDTENTLGRFSWGKGIVPSTAEPVATLNGVALYTLNRIGKGTVFFSGTLLPNRSYLTGFDLSSGMDPTLGFAKLAAEANAAQKPVPGALYFDRNQLPLEPYFHFTFATGSALFRSAYVSFVSKETLGYSVTKVLGPYGRPAMGHQNHFEALEAIRDGEGIQWAELLKKYKQVPSFSLVRSSFTWGRWQESVAVHLNTGTNAKPTFAGETPNSFYSSGTRLMSQDGPIRLANYPEYKSLGDPITLPYRAYPALADITGDGRADLVVGSGDGKVYLYRGLAQAAAELYAGQQLPPAGGPAPAAFGQREPVHLASGAPLAVGQYASIAAYDVNADGRPDLLVGRPDGTLAVAYGEAGGVFAPPAPLMAGGQLVRAAAPVAAAVGDVTGDAVPDLVVGDGGGAVTVYRGERSAAGALAWGAGSTIVQLPARFAAPSIRDMDGDGRADLVVGSLEGDLRIYLQQVGAGGASTWRDAGVIEAATVNQLGNHALVGGHNAVPFWADLNGDGKDDLIVGQLEFGIPSNIDDPTFPYKEQLDEFIQYNKTHQLELYPHLFVHNFTSDAQEKQEIALHQQAFAKLGIPWGMTGTNQHTWRINNPDRAQTLNNERDASIWFNFGFKPSDIKNEPRLGIEYNWGMPFLMADASGAPDLKRPMLLSTPAPVLRTEAKYSTEDLFSEYTALDLPIDYFEHIEYHFPANVQPLLEFVRYLDKLRTEYGYNFMSEPQMARSYMNTLTTKVSLYRPWRDVLIDHLRKALGRTVEPSFRVQPLTAGVPAQAAEYKGTLGLMIEPGQPYAEKQAVAAQAEVRDRRGDKLYVGVPSETTIRFVSPEHAAYSDSLLHITRSNVPYELLTEAKTWSLQLRAPGMQQVQLYSPQPLTIQGPDISVERDEAKQTYTVTHFGEPVTLTITHP
ncbi:FG-GAP repeat domain-containing protein [Paenibacillus cremeus]|uniref:VCBS repeat-containing protein n=1 Tax=Paenibacillus cremeus TaxID=2163881 RepID=A0A559KB59_9BACL|nr:VCBS repeat-containing protein [Paenibacillus cremeus]TVY09368.1 VCBS repeat-containing protein [Paenibacillus cremeus]